MTIYIVYTPGVEDIFEWTTTEDYLPFVYVKFKIELA